MAEPESILRTLRRIALGVRRRLGLRPPAERVVPYAAGLRFYADPSDLIEREVYTTGWYERPTAEVITTALRPGDVCVDVGAHVGSHTLVAARVVGPQGLVVALEPNPPSVLRLRRNLALNGFEPRVQILEVAASDHQRTAALYPSDDPINSGGASLGGQATPTAGITVPCDTLDQLIDENLAARTVVVKLDVEGLEWHALAGARQLLTHHPIIVYESNGPEPAQLLGSVGFDLYEMIGVRPALARIPDRELDRVVAPGRALNVVAMRRGSIAYDRLLELIEPDEPGR